MAMFTSSVTAVWLCKQLGYNRDFYEGPGVYRFDLDDEGNVLDAFQMTTTNRFLPGYTLSRITHYPNTGGYEGYEARPGGSRTLEYFWVVSQG